MNYFDLYSSYPDRTIAAAWDSQVKEADKTPWLAGTLTECGGELFARFAACYAELRALPRSARRALQRRIARSSEPAAILPEYLQTRRKTTAAQDGLVLGRRRFTARTGTRSGTAATITVTTNNPYIISDGQCSLIEAIVNANNDAATYPDCAAGSGADTIVLPANANLTLSAVYAKTYGQSATPSVCLRLPVKSLSKVTAPRSARQANAPDFGLMAVRGSDFLGVGVPPGPRGDLTLQDVTLSGGSSFGGLLNSGTASIKNSIISGNSGGGVSNNGTLTSKTAPSQVIRPLRGWRHI